MTFCHLDIVSGVVDARKWRAKWRNWNISDIFFTLSSIEGRKQRRQPETLATYIGIMPHSFDISDTPRSGRPSGFDEDRLNILIHNDPRQCRPALK